MRLPRSLTQRSTSIIVIASYSTWFIGLVMKVPMRKLLGYWPRNLVMLPTLFPTSIHAIPLSRDLTPLKNVTRMGNYITNNYKQPMTACHGTTSPHLLCPLPTSLRPFPTPLRPRCPPPSPFRPRRLPPSISVPLRDVRPPPRHYLKAHSQYACTIVWHVSPD